MATFLLAFPCLRFLACVSSCVSLPAFPCVRFLACVFFHAFSCVRSLRAFTCLRFLACVSLPAFPCLRFLACVSLREFSLRAFATHFLKNTLRTFSYIDLFDAFHFAV
jgi:hypothetical protein